MNVLDNSVIIKGSKNGITVFLDEEMPFEELLENVSDKFKNASKFLIMQLWQFLLMEETYLLKKKKRILNVISDVSELNIVCVLDENNDIKSVYEEAVKKAMNSFNISHQPERQKITDPKLHVCFIREHFVRVRCLRQTEVLLF